MFTLFLLLVAVLAAEMDRPVIAWLALFAACLTRPQVLVFGLLLGVVLLVRVDWRRTLTSLSWAILITFVILLPFTLATSPSLPIDILLNNLHIQEASGNDVALTTVSQDAFSVWPLVTYLVHGASGLQRSFTPSSTPLVGSLTYQTAGQIITIIVLLSVVAFLVLRRNQVRSNGEYLPLVTFGAVAFLMFVPGLLATHFLLAMPFLLLCRRWMSNVAFFYVVATWSVTTLVPMYGDMGVLISSIDYPQLAQANNHVTRLFVYLYTSDRFITVATVANVCAMVWLAMIALRQSRGSISTAAARAAAS